MKMYIMIGMAVLVLGGFVIYCKVRKLKVKEAISLFMDIVEKILGKGKGQEKFNLLLELLFLYLKSQIKSTWLLAIINILFPTKKIGNIVNTDLGIKQISGTYNNTFDLSDFNFSALEKKNYIEAYAENDLKDFMNSNNAKIGVAIGRKF